MIISIKMAWYILVILSIIDIYAVIFIYLKKYNNDKKVENIFKMSEYMLDIDKAMENNKVRKYIIRNKKLFLIEYAKFRQTLSYDNENIKNVNKCICEFKIDKYYVKRLKSTFRIKRIEAATYLGNISNGYVKNALKKALKTNKDYVVKLYLCNSLVNLGDERAIEYIINSLIGAPKWYRDKIQVLLADFGQKIYEFIYQIIDRKEEEIQELVIYLANIYQEERLEKYLLEKIEDENKELAYKAMEVIISNYPNKFDIDKYVKDTDHNIRKLAIKAIANKNSKESLIKLMDLIGNEEQDEDIINSVSNILRNKSQYISFVISRFQNETNYYIKTCIAAILSNNIEYLFLKLMTKGNEEKNYIKDIIKEIFLNGRISEVIIFLNSNKNVEMQNEILQIVMEVSQIDENLKNQFCIYLNEELLEKIDFEKIQELSKQKKVENAKGKTLYLIILLLIIVLFFPAIYFIRHWDIVFSVDIIEQIKIYILDFNYHLVYYSTSINLIYFIILAFSFIGIEKQKRYWNLKGMSFMFKQKILPSISVIAPAYNEEETIIESVNSLLNLKYPDYELIIVNDGSKDKTLNRVIDYFQLKKVDSIINNKLKTMPVRGVYINKSNSKLIVVDKENGGKADALNVGINFSNKKYICGIDADSLLEPEALIKIASSCIDSKYECVAVGGNIFPINGCDIDRGHISKMRIPKNNVARFQTVEYLRAFMCGRIGWAYVNCLLIISGAFGLFKKDRITEIGGYLTSSERYKLDTVGEDMELVVRLSCHMREKGLKYEINYCYNANCWTEVPEGISMLKKQRDRWQRGLIDILYFHRKVMSNPKYGTMGWVSLPYFFVFEMAGPLIEFEGYLMVVLAIIFGLLNTQIAIMLFIAVVMLGVGISIFSIIIAEEDKNYFSMKEITILIFYAIIENFGYKQISSLWRVFGYFNSMKTSKGWGEMKRKGFSKESVS